MQLLVKVVLWLHVSLYRLTNGRIGGRFIADSPILLLTTTGLAEIQVGAERLTVRARTADPAERRRLFPCFVEMYQGYGAYELKTSRKSRWCC